MSEEALKLIGECSKERLPSYVERLIIDVKSELGDSLTDYDLTVVLLFGLMAETGFTPLSPEDALTGQESPDGSNFDTQKLKAIKKMPNNWRNPNGSSYSMKFHLNRFRDSICQFLASKIEAGTNTVPIEDNLIVNLFVTCSPTAKAIHVQPSRYVASKNADIPDMFDKLDELSMLFKNAVHPLRNTILEEYGRINASLIGIPTEIKLQIFEYLSVPDGWKVLSETCTELHILGNDPMLWKYYLTRDFGSIANHRVSVEELTRATSDVNWKTEYVARLSKKRGVEKARQQWIHNIRSLRWYAREDREGRIQLPAPVYLERLLRPPAGINFMERGPRFRAPGLMDRRLRQSTSNFLEGGRYQSTPDFLERGLPLPTPDFRERGLYQPTPDILERELPLPTLDFLERELYQPTPDILKRGLPLPALDFLERGLRQPTPEMDRL